MDYYSTKVISNKKIAPNIYVITIKHLGETIKPGQFYMLKVYDNALPLLRPISIYRINEESLSFMYRISGKGTTCLSKLKSHSDIQLLGPLGNGFPCSQVKGKIALVGGGIGIPPLYETAKLLKQMGNQVDVYMGYKDILFGFEDFEEVSDSIFISSEVGNEGYHGFITELLHPQDYAAVFTCGPEVMMLKIKAMCDEVNTPIWLSMEKRMACGIGACLGCSCKTKDGMKRVCKEGPVFYGNELNY